MSIWLNNFTLDELNHRSKNTLADFLEIKFTAMNENSMTATMPVSERTKQPIGIVHGGANVVLAETLASTAANAAVDLNICYCVGLEINANHIRAVKTGILTAITRPLHIGRSTHVWLIDLFNDDGQLTCTSRMTACVVKK